MNKFLPLFLFAFSLGAAEEDFRYFQLLTPPEKTDAARLNAITLTPEVIFLLGNSNDLRVYSPAGDELPFQREPRNKAGKFTAFVRVPSVAESFDVHSGTAVTILDLTTDAPVGRVVIETPEQNFEKRVSIHGFDGKSWKILCENRMFFDRNPRFPIANRAFDFPEGQWKKLKVEIANYGENYVSPLRKVTEGSASGVIEEKEVFFRELRISAMETYRKEQGITTTPVLQEYVPSSVDVRTNADARTTEVHFPAGKLPVVRLALRADGVNFSREARLFAENGKEEAHVYLERIALEGYANESLEFSLPELQLGKAKLVIYNKDNPPLTGLSVRLLVPEFRLLTLPGTVPEKLRFVSAGLPPGEYDLWRTLARLETAALDCNEYKPGAVEENSAFSGRRKTGDLDGKTVFTVVASLLALVLGIFCIRGFSRLSAGEEK